MSKNHLRAQVIRAAVSGLMHGEKGKDTNDYCEVLTKLADELEAEKLTPLEVILATSLKQAHKYVSYVEAFRGRLTARKDMEDVMTNWRSHRPASIGIGVGATYLCDAEFNFELAEKAIAAAEAKNGATLPLPVIWA